MGPLLYSPISSATVIRCHLELKASEFGSNLGTYNISGLQLAYNFYSQEELFFLTCIPGTLVPQSCYSLLRIKMWCYFVECKGYHYRKRKKRRKRKLPPPPTLRQMLFSSLLAASSLLLTSSVHVATLAMQPRLVELWKYRVQHLRQFYCKLKHQQEGTSRGVYSGQLNHIRIPLMLWVIVVSSAIFLAMNIDIVAEGLGFVSSIGRCIK